jgi:diguanylate cyclase (GGDEF)-like protein/PAS domain S-box-containing protein
VSPAETAAHAGESVEGARVGIEALGDGVLLVDSSHDVVAINAAACRLFGYEPAEVVGRSLDMLLPLRAVGRHEQQVAGFGADRVAQGPMSSLRTVTGRRKGGGEFPAEITIGKSVTGGRQRFTAVVRDVSAERRIETDQLGRIEQLQAILERAGEGIVVTDELGTISYASPYIERLQCVESGGLVGRNVGAYVHPDDLAATIARFADAVAGSAPEMRFETRLRVRDGEWIWVEATMTLPSSPLVGGFVTNFRDVTERRAEDARREAVAEFGLWALRSASLPQLMRRAADLTVAFLDADAGAVFERDPDSEGEVIGRAWAGWSQDLVGTRAPAPAGSPMGRTLASGSHFVVNEYDVEPWFPGKELIERAGLHSSLGAVITVGGARWGVLGVMSARPARFSAADIAFTQAVANVLGAALDREHIELLRAEEALHDSLTGLPNRLLITTMLEHALEGSDCAPGESAALVVVDIDNFKQVNDAFGHDVGDELLVEMARRLEAVIGPQDTLGRLGGDEFVIVTSERPGTADPLSLAVRVQDRMRQPFELGARDLHVTVSIGIAVAAHDRRTAGALLQDADVAKCEAKRSGRNCRVIFDRTSRAPVVARASLEHELHRAMARDEFALHYQPVVNSDTGELVGSEALLRWIHPERGVISPGEFIPALEDTGMIVPVGRWVIQRACEQVAEWRARYGRSDLSVSVNLSPVQLGDAGLVAAIRRTLVSTGIPASSLNVELTETMVVDDLEHALSAVESIAGLGINVLIDDFGTGYSSLSYLKRLPVSCIKIDRSFVTDVCTDPADQAIIGAVSQLARGLGLCSVAEGVETSEQLAMVRKLGCRLIQGFYYSGALAPSDFESRWFAVPALPAAR